MYYIYIIQKKDDHRIYVGQTINCKARWKDHRVVANSCKSNPNSKRIKYIHRALSKYGFDAFDFYILQECKSQEEVNEMERFWVSILQTTDKNFGFNLVPGGGSFSGSDHPSYGKIGLESNSCVLTEDIEKDIIHKYVNEKMTMAQIADNYDFTAKPVVNCLRRYGIKRRNVGHYKKIKDPHEYLACKEQEICKKYINGEANIYDLSKMYDCEWFCIHKILNKNNISLLENRILSKDSKPVIDKKTKQKALSYNKLFSLEQEKEICDKYVNKKMTVEQISKDYNFNIRAILNCLHRHNIEIRDVGFYRKNAEPVKKSFNKEQEKEICDRYTNEHISIWRLGEMYNCTGSCLYKVLKRNNITILGNKVLSKGKRYSPETEFKKGQIPHNKLFSPEQEREICNIYLNERLNTAEIGKIYNCNRCIISGVLDRNNVKKRDRGRFTEDEKTIILDKLYNGQSLTSLSKEYGVAKVVIKGWSKKIK